MFIGSGTVVNVMAVLLGGGLGVLLGHRVNERARATITDVLGLVTLVIGALSLRVLTSGALSAAVGGAGVMVVVLLGLLGGGLIGSWLGLEDRLEAWGERARRRFARADDQRWGEGFVTSTLVFCVGPLAILGSLSDGLGRGADQLYVKAVLDGFAAMAFASALGAGVLLSAVSVLVYQGVLTLVGYVLGAVLPTSYVDAITASGGVILIGLGFRLLGIKQIRVVDLLPALALTPVLVWVSVVARRWLGF